MFISLFTNLTLFLNSMPFKCAWGELDIVITIGVAYINMPVCDKFVLNSSFLHTRRIIK